MGMLSGICLKVGLISHGHNPGAPEWALLLLGSGGRGCGSVPIPCGWGLRCPVRPLLQKEVKGRKLSFILLLQEARIMSPGEGQLQTPPMAKSNYKPYPQWNASRAWLCFVWDADWQFCLWCIQEDMSIKESLTRGAHSDLHFNSFSLSVDMPLIFQEQAPINPDRSCLRIMLIIY